MTRYRPTQIDTKSAAYARMTAAGFRFEVGPLGPSYLSGVMTCVCGRRERFSINLRHARNGKIDVASYAEAIGAASAGHLRQDGYTTEQVMAIRRAFV